MVHHLERYGQHIADVREGDLRRCACGFAWTSAGPSVLASSDQEARA